MDEIIKNNIQLKYKGIPTRIDLVQYTNAMRLVFVLTDYPMPSGATARIYVKKPSGKEVYNVATISGDTVTVSTTTQMTAEAGTNNAQLQIVKGSIVAASFVFYLHVQPNIAEDTAIESSNEYGVLDGLIADANNLIDQARAALGGITPINNLTSTDASKPLAAPMGKLLDDKISSLNADLVYRGDTRDLNSVVNAIVPKSVIINAVLYDAVGNPVASSGFCITFYHNDTNVSQWVFDLLGGVHFRTRREDKVMDWVRKM